jgi:surface protein
MGLYRDTTSSLSRGVDVSVSKQVTGSNDNDAFISVWSTTVDDESITIPAQGGTFNAVVDWGDNSSPETVTSPTGFVHPYDTAGDYTISITGTFPNIFLNGGTSAPKLKKVLNLGKVGWTTFANAFKGCSNLTEFTVGSTDTSSVTNMSEMFRSCTLLTSLDVSNFDTSSVTNMYVMFFGCSGLTSINVSSFNTSIVTTMSYMFYDCDSLTSLDVSSFSTGNVITMTNMFRECTSLTSLDLSLFNTENVTSMATVFLNCNALTSIVGIEDWIITGLNSVGSLTNFLTVGKMTTAQYDNLLINWEAQASGIPAMTPSFGASKYTGGGTAATAHASLNSAYGWSIGDGGIA